MPRASSTSHHATVVDGASLFDAAEAIGNRFGRSKVTVDYTKLNERLADLRRQEGWSTATVSTILLSIDPNSEGQQRFQTMLKHAGFEPDVVYFRDVFVSLPPGKSPADTSAKSTVTLASRLTYIAGLMARHPSSAFLVVTHSFELYGPLLDLAERLDQGKVGLAYFGSLLDYRWRLAGLMDGKLGIKFFDLDPYGQELVGVELISKATDQQQFRSGLKRF